MISTDKKYEVRLMNGGNYDNGKLTCRFASIADAETAIDEANSRAAERGYEPEWMMITEVAWNKAYSTDGMFLCESVTECAVMLYKDGEERSIS